MSLLAQGSTYPFAAPNDGATVTLSVNGGCVASWSGALSGVIGPVPGRIVVGPLNIGQSVTFSADIGSCTLEFGDATPNEFGNASPAVFDSQGRLLGAGGVVLDAATAQARIAGEVWVADPEFGGVFDGVTDDWAAFQSAANSVPDFGVLVLPSGKSRCNQRVVINADNVVVRGPGAASCEIACYSTNGLFRYEGTVGELVSIGGFTAVAAVAGAGRPIDIDYDTSTNLNLKTAHVQDVIAEVRGSGYWSGGVRINNARNSVIDGLYVHGQTSLTTADVVKIEGEATDVKITNTQGASVAVGADISGTAEGTIFNNFVVVDCNIGVSKVHSGNAEPWVELTNWHINARQKGIVLTNVLQSQINPGLLYANQNATGDWVGIEIDGALSQDISVNDVDVNGQLATGATSKTAIVMKAGARLSARVKPISMTRGAHLQASTSNCNVIIVNPTAVTDPFLDEGTDNLVGMIRNGGTDGWMVPSPGGFINGSKAVSINKPSQMRLWGRDTAGTVKIGGTVRAMPADANWTASDVFIEARRADAVVPVAKAKSTGALNFIAMAADPATAENGDVYYNSTTNKLRVRTSGAWADLH